jgi:hypothetical protein
LEGKGAADRNPEPDHGTDGRTEARRRNQRERSLVALSVARTAAAVANARDEIKTVVLDLWEEITSLF